MSQKQIKNLNRHIKKVAGPEWDKFYEDLQKYGWKTRLHVAWAILFRTKVREKKREERLHKKKLAKDQKQNRLDAAERDARRKARKS